MIRIGKSISDAANWLSLCWDLFFKNSVLANHFFSTTTIIQTRTLTLQSSLFVTQTSLHYYRWHMNPPEVEILCSIVNNRYTGEDGRARKKLEEMPEKSGHKNPSNGLHAFCAFIIHNKRNSTSLKIFRSYRASRVASDLIRNLSAFDVTALSRVIRLSCRFHARRKTCRAKRLEVYNVEWLKYWKWENPSEQCSWCSGGLPLLVPRVVCTKSHLLVFNKK